MDLTVAQGFGLAGFGISVVLAVLRLWEAFPRSKLDVDFEWAWSEGQDVPDELRFYIANLGRRKDSVRDVRFGSQELMDAQWRGWSPSQGWFPLIVDVDEVHGPFIIDVSSNRFARRLVGGEYDRAVLEDARRKTSIHVIPRPTMAPDKRPPDSV